MRKVILLLIVFLVIMGCNNKSEAVKMLPVNNSWQKKDEKKFDFNITDSQTRKNIIFVVRNNEHYPYSNIRFIVHFTHLKTNKKETDTLNYTLAKPNGEWLGTGFGTTKEILFQYRLNYKFPADGTYRIGIVQAMRKDALPGIEDIGVKIEQARP